MLVESKEALPLSANGDLHSGDKKFGEKTALDGRAFVERLKLQRIIAIGSVKRTMMGRARRKFSELVSHGFSLLGIFSYFAVRGLAIFKRELPNCLHNIVGKVGKSQHLYAEPVFVALRITGGVGDAVMVARLLATLSSEADGDEYVIDLFYNKPENIKFIFKKQGRVRVILEDTLFERIRGTYDLSGAVNQFITFNIESANWTKMIARSPRLCAAVRASEHKRKDFDVFISHHPLLDGSFADAAVRMGCARHTFLHYQTDMPLKEPQLDIELSRSCPDKFSLVPGSYLTVHDGWDAEYRLVAKRPTKVYPPKLWEEAVALIKEEFPHLTIVQLGGKTGQSISNVDRDLRNRTTLEEAAAIIQSALAHVDTESGLVHLARCLGTPSVVLFGPTNADFFAYKENRNIVPNSCGNCWWSTDAWMDACPRGLSTPDCLDSIPPARVAAEVSHFIHPQMRANAGLSASRL